MKNQLRLAAGLAAASLVLAGCAGSDDDQAIELWTAWTEGEATAQASEELIEKFEEDTGYTVNQQNFTYDMLYEKVIASAAGDNLPDVVWGLPEYVGEFHKMGILANLSDAWDEWEDEDLVSDAVQMSMTVKGEVVGFPYETTARAFLVHDDLFVQAGVEAPVTWEDVIEIGTAVEDATGSSAFGIAGTGVRAPQELLVYLAQKGLTIAEEQEGGGYRNTWNDDDAQLARAAEVFQFYVDAFESGAVNPNSATYGWEQTDENFATGITASYVTGNWLAEREETNPEAMADVSVHPVPYPSNGEPATYIEAKPMFVMGSSDNLQGATELARAFASEEWQQAAFADRSAISTVSTDSKWSQDFNPLLEAGVTYPPVALGGVTQAMIDSLAMVLQEGTSAEEAATWLSEEINVSLENSGDLSES